MPIATFFRTLQRPLEDGAARRSAVGPRFRLPAAGSFFWVFLGAILLRAVYLWEAFQNNELIAFPVVDGEVYVRWARDILAGQWLWKEAINYTPGHPLWLAGWLALFGWNPAMHFAVFLLLGAMQAVVVGRTAELLWDRRAGLVAGWLAATYWPLIIFEASYFAEPFAILNLSLALFLTVRWSRDPASVRPVFWAGFCLGWSILARANAMLCAPVIAAWIAWVRFRAPAPARLLRGVTAAAAFALPVAMMLAPVMYWNWKITGRAMLRTDGWLSMYAGNDPALRALAMPVGVRWSDFVYRPVRAGFTDPSSKEDFWRDETRRVIREQPAEWRRLMARKAMMLTGSFEVSQEIDIAAFRGASRVLSLPVWPGWGLVIPLAVCGLLGMGFSPSARRAWPLALCAAAYFASIVPVQAAARYRLPVIVIVIPIAAWAVVALADAVRRREYRPLVGMAAVIGITSLLLWPDWLQLGREKIVNHWFFIGIKRAANGDDTGAYAAFAKGAEWNPRDPDCPLRMADLARSGGDLEKAQGLYRRALENLPACHDAIIGLGECALSLNRPEDAFRRAKEALALAPNNLDALKLASRTFAKLGNWEGMARTCEQMRSYPAHPASVAFAEAWAWYMAGKPAQALRLYDFIAGEARFSNVERMRAAFLGGALVWRSASHRGEAVRRWQYAAGSGDAGFFPLLAGMLTGKTSPETALVAMPAGLPQSSTLYVAYTRGVEASLRGDLAEARTRFEDVLATRNARQLPIAERDILEIWAQQDLDRAPR